MNTSEIMDMNPKRGGDLNRRQRRQLRISNCLSLLTLLPPVKTRSPRGRGQLRSAMNFEQTWTLTGNRGVSRWRRGDCRASESPLLTASLDFFELSYGNPVVVTIHCFLGADQGLKVENPAIAKGQFQFDALLQNALKIADAEDFAQAIHHAPIGLQIEILQTSALLGREREGQIRVGEMDSDEIGSDGGGRTAVSAGTGREGMMREFGIHDRADRAVRAPWLCGAIRSFFMSNRRFFFMFDVKNARVKPLESSRFRGVSLCLGKGQFAAL